jgi:amino acid transporter
VATEPDNSRAHQAETDRISGEEELKHLAYEQELKRPLSLVGNVALVIAAMTPATALLIIGPFALRQVGTGAFWAYLLAGVMAVCIVLCCAELGFVYPTAGGQYPIATGVLGKELGYEDVETAALGRGGATSARVAR